MYAVKCIYTVYVYVYAYVYAALKQWSSMYACACHALTA